MERADDFLVSGDLEKCCYWTNKANQEIARAGYRGHGWEAPASLGMGDVLKTIVKEVA